MDLSKCPICDGKVLHIKENNTIKIRCTDCGSDTNMMSLIDKCTKKMMTPENLGRIIKELLIVCGHFDDVNMKLRIDGKELGNLTEVLEDALDFDHHNNIILYKGRLLSSQYNLYSSFGQAFLGLRTI